MVSLRKFLSDWFGDLPVWVGLGLLLLLPIVVGGLAGSATGDHWETVVQRPIQFHLRSALGQDPKIDPRVKVYALDDLTTTYMDREELTLEEWEKIFKFLGQRDPAAVLVDKMFVSRPDAKGAARFKETVGNLPYPLISGALLYPNPSPKAFDLNERHYRLPGALRFLPIVKAYPVGPHKDLRGAFSHIGQFNYKDASNYVRPWIRVSETAVVPHTSVLTDPMKAWKNGRLAIPLDAEGKTLINLGRPETWYNRTYSLKGLLKRIHRGEPPPKLAKDSIVLLIYLQSPDTDRVRTPFGEVPGGYVPAALVNSLLTGQWITQSPLRGVQAASVSLVGGLVGLLTFGWTYFLLLAAGVVGLFLAGIAAFAWGGWEFPWMFWVGGFGGTALIIYLERMRRMERRTRRVRAAIDGRVPPQQLQQIIARPVEHEPAARDVTVMFVDIVGFFLAAERKTAAGAFVSLKFFLGELASIIHRHHGIVDKTLGDGILAYFGYDFGKNASIPNHANLALGCASEMQRWVLNFNLREGQAGRSMYPLRIGINSGEVYLGDLGSEERMDFTLIGHPVNFAQRLESACEDYQVMVGAATFDRANTQRWVFTPRKIQIKHYEQLMEAWELDPFEGMNHEKERALNYYRQSLGKARQTPRWDVPPELGLGIQTREGYVGEVRNYSQFGLAVVMDAYLARGVSVQFELRDNGNLKRALRRHGLAPLVAEVRWGRRLATGKYLHGLKISNLTELQGRQLVGLLRSAGNLVEKTG